LGYDADQTAAICGPDWWCTCASRVKLVKDHAHNFFCRRSVYDYTKFLYLPLDTLGLTSVADVKHLHVLYLPTITKDDRFVAVVVYSDAKKLKADKKTDDLVFYLKALALADELPIEGKFPASLYFTEEFSIDVTPQIRTDTLFPHRGHDQSAIDDVGSPPTSLGSGPSPSLKWIPKPLPEPTTRAANQKLLRELSRSSSLGSALSLSGRSGRDRFRAAARRVIAEKRLSTVDSDPSGSRKED